MEHMGEMGMGGMGMGGMDMSGGGGHKMSYTHMTFFWGKNSEILFDGWPGARTGMYVLALIVVFVLSVLVEWLSHCRLIGSGWARASAGLVQTAVHTVRVGLAYLVMLAVMSFNVGVLIAAVAGHAVGFLLFSSSVFNRSDPPAAYGNPGGALPPMKC